VIEDTVSHFKRIPLSGCIFTKVDECMSLGELISVVIQNALPIGYMTNGQRVPEDLEIIEPAKLVEQAKIMFEKNTSSEHIWFSDVESRVVGMYD
jgi:flagellar biosynthesis protein FlhF